MLQNASKQATTYTATKMNISYNENFLKNKKRTKENVFFYKNTIERAEKSYRILNQLKKAATFFVDGSFSLIESDNTDEFQTIFLKLCYTVITPRYYEFIDLSDELLLTLVIQDDVKLSDLKKEVLMEVERFSNYYYKIIKSSTFVEFSEMVDAFCEETKLIENVTTSKRI